MPVTNASSLTFSDIRVNSIFSLNNTLFSHYTIDSLRENVLNSSTINSIETNISNLSSITSMNLVDLTNTNSSVNSIENYQTEITTTISNINTNISTIFTNTSNTDNNIDNLTTLVTTNISTLNSSVSELKNSIIVLTGYFGDENATENASFVYLQNSVSDINISLISLKNDSLLLAQEISNASTFINNVEDIVTISNASVNTLNTNLVTANTSINTLNTSVLTLINNTSTMSTIITKTNLINTSSSTICSFGITNMSRVYVGNENTSVYIGGSLYSSGGGTITSLSSPLTISYTPSSITSNTMIGFVITSGNVTTTKNSTQFESTDIDPPTSEPYGSYGISPGLLAGITVPAGVWLVKWLTDVYDANNQLNYDNYMATGVTKNSFTGTGGGIHQGAAWALAKQAGVSASHNIYPLTDSNFYTGSYYIARFPGVNQSSKSSASNITNYAQYGSRSTISNSFVLSATASTTLKHFYGMAGQPFVFGNIVFTSRIVATRIG